VQSTHISLLYFTFDHKWEDWAKDSFPDRSSLIFKNLWKNPKVDKVLLINSASSVFKVRFRGEKQRNWIKRGIFFNLEKVDEKLYVLHQSRIFPKDKSNSVSIYLNGLIHDKYLVSTVNYWAKKLEMHNLILWISNPLQACFIGKFGEKVCVYDATDDWSLHPDYKHLWTKFKKCYKVISERADAILAVSQSLKSKFESLNGEKRNVFWVPNGVEWDIFKIERFETPNDLRKVPKPILGYVGVLQKRVDVELFEKICLAFPKASIVLVGPTLSPRYFSSLKQFKNIFFLGAKNHLEIPKYIKNFDVCLMPHKVSEFTGSMDPVKIYEYLAAGKPVVSTFIPGLERFSPYIYLSKTSEEFVSNVKASLRERNPDLVKRRQDFARQNSWMFRVQEVVKLLEEKLTEKQLVNLRRGNDGGN